MSGKIRKQIYIEPQQEILLKTLAQQAGMSEAEMIRQAIDRHLGAVTCPTPNLAVWENEKAFIAQIKERTPQPGGRDWQREDLYER
jgi:hypothetical protein